MQPKIRSAQFVFTRDTCSHEDESGRKMQISAESVNFRTTSPYSAASKNKSTVTGILVRADLIYRGNFGPPDQNYQ